MWNSIKRALRSPKIITAELSLLSAVLLLMTVIPQRTDGEAWEKFSGSSPGAASLLERFGLDAVTGNPLFLVLVLLAGCSLGIVLIEQWRRFFRTRREELVPAHFGAAPFRKEFVRPAGEPVIASFSVRSTGRIGSLGSPLFHSGLMLIILAGILRILFFRQALVPLVLGETLPAEPGVYAVQEGGWLSRPFALDAPMRLLALSPENYGSGALKGLSAEVGLGAGTGMRIKKLAINAPLGFGFETLYLNQTFGPAALLEWNGEGSVDRRAILLRPEGSQEEGRVGKDEMPGGFEVRLRGYSVRGAPDPGFLEVRILKGGALLFTGDLRSGQYAGLLTGERLTLLGISRWAEFRGTRDYSVWPAYIGFLLAGLGAFLMFAVIKVDEAVEVTPVEGGERVVVALRAARFAPLFAERFQRLLERQRNGAVVE